MKKHLLFILTAILSFNCYAQIAFEKGYYINDNDLRIDCLIKNIDWKNNPTTFEYKLTEDAKVELEVLKNIKGFGFDDATKYIKAAVKIDRSSENINYLSKEKDPIFSQEILFLKVIIEGKASLYQYTDGELRRYFYRIENNQIEQLIFKTYAVDGINIAKNYRFRQQLWAELNCSTISMKKVNNLNYTKKDLVGLFIDYNKCNNQETTNYDIKPSQKFFNLTLRPGFNSSSLSIQHSNSNSRDADFGNQFNFRFGIEAEFTLPFNKNKWAIIVEPNYQYYKGEEDLKIQHVTVNYKSLELPLGLRHYLFLNNDSKFFANVSYVLDFGIDSTIEFKPGTVLDVTMSGNLAFGMGYKYLNKYSLELRYLTNRSVLNKYSGWSSEYNTISVLFGYSLF